MAAQIIARHQIHSGFTTLTKLRLRLQDGTEFDREVEDHGRAVAVLPYDPVRRTAILVRLLRAPVLSTTGNGDVLEAPAGLVDAEEGAVDAARRELHEETGLVTTHLEHVGCVWTSPGISTERMDLYLALYSVRDRVGSGGGLAEEHENTTVTEMPLRALLAYVNSGQIVDMKTLTLVLMLRARQPKLFEAQ